MQYATEKGSTSGVKSKRASLLSTLLWATIILQSPGGFAETLESHQPTPDKCDQASPCPPPNTQKSHWLDTSREYVATQSDNLAVWLDDFFGVPKSDLESASTSLRLQFRNRWEEGDGNDFKVSLRGNIQLPQVSERLSLIFTDEIEEGTDERSSAKEIIDNPKDNTDVALQYNVLEHIRSRLDLRLGLSSSLDPKVSGRYRYRTPFMEKYLAEITEKVYFEGDDGFGSITRFNIDRAIAENRLLRWSNRFQYAEESEGVEWSTNVSLNQRLSEKRAIAYVVGTAGETRPDYLTTNYGMSVIFRQSVFRPWLFVELEPAYQWKRPDTEDNRSGVAQFTVRLEVRFADD